MIAVSFYTVSKKENSTKLPSNPVVMECSIKDDCSVLSPSLIIKAGTNTVPAFNYCYIQDFGRYYWITQWSWVRGVWQCACNVDVLASWRSYIGASRQYILRSASAYDGNIIDSLYPFKTNKETRFANIELFDATTLESGSFIIGVINQDVLNETITLGTVSYYYITIDNLKLLKEKLLDTSIWGSVIKDYANPLQFIVSVNWLPFDLNITDLEHVLKCGNIDLTGVKVRDLNAPIKTIEKDIYPPFHPSYLRGEYTFNLPFSEYVLYNDALGTIPLDFSTDTPQRESEGVYQRKGVKLVCRVDVITGKTNLRVVIKDSQSAIEHVIGEANGNVSVPIQLAQVTSWSAKDLGNAIVNGAIGVSSIKSAPTNLSGAISGGLGFIQSAIEASAPSLTSLGSNGSINAIAVPTVLKATFNMPVDENIEHRGRPLCQERTINTLMGYVLCSDVELEIPCTADELTRITSYMEGGFYYE